MIKAKLLLGLIFLLASGQLSTAYGQFSNNDLRGDYLLTQYINDATDGASGGLAIVHMDGSGEGSLDLFFNSAGDTGIGNLTYSVNEDGTMSLQTDDEDIKGIVEAGGNSFTMSELTNDVKGFYLATKLGSGMTTADLSGEYLAVSYTTDTESTNTLARTRFTSAVFDGSGGGTFDTFVSSDSDRPNGSLTYAVNDSGMVHIVADGDTLQGALSMNKDLLIMSVTGGGTQGTFFGIRKSSGNSNASLSGGFVGSLYIQDNLVDESALADFDFDGAGNASFLSIQTASGTEASGSFPYEVADDGSWVVTNETGQIGVQSADGIWFSWMSAEGNLGIAAGIKAPQRVTSNEDELPQSRLFRLSSYPNPMKTQSQISFELDKAAEIELSIYDLFGRKVEVLAEQFFPAGQHALVWKGQKLSPGIYIARLRSGGLSESERIIRVD